MPSATVSVEVRGQDVLVSVCPEPIHLNGNGSAAVPILWNIDQASPGWTFSTDSTNPGIVVAGSKFDGTSPGNGPSNNNRKFQVTRIANGADLESYKYTINVVNSALHRTGKLDPTINNQP